MKHIPTLSIPFHFGAEVIHLSELKRYPIYDGIITVSVLSSFQHTGVVVVWLMEKVIEKVTGQCHYSGIQWA